MSKTLHDPLLKDDKNRFVIFPVKHHDIWDWYKKMQSKFWTVHSELSDHQLENSQQELTVNEIHFLQNILALLSGSQKLVTENLTQNIKKQINSDEAGFCLNFQSTTENIHFESFSLLTQSFIENRKNQNKLSTKVLPQLQLVEDLAKKWSDAEQFIASVAFNAIFFSGGVSALLWFRKKDRLPGLTYYAQLISRDKTYHRDFIIDLYLKHLDLKISGEKIKEIVLEIKGMSREFLTQNLPVNLIDMPKVHMEQYLDLVTEDLMKKLGYDAKNQKKEISANNQQKSSLPEKRVSQLRKTANKHIDKDSDKVTTNADH